MLMIHYLIDFEEFQNINLNCYLDHYLQRLSPSILDFVTFLFLLKLFIYIW